MPTGRLTIVSVVVAVAALVLVFELLRRRRLREKYAVIWVLISEVFPNAQRAAGQSLGSATHWVFAAALTTVFPWMVGAFAPGWLFVFFAGMMVLQLLWVRTMVPETKGVPLEELQRRLGVRAS